MKLLGVLWLLVILATAIVMPGGSVSAQAQVHNNQLKITGIVLPAQHVVVNTHGTILEITSNTTHDIMPKVYVNEISPQNLRTMTPEIYNQYRQIVPEGQSKVGVLYKYKPGMYTFTSPDKLFSPQSNPYELPFSTPADQ